MLDKTLWTPDYEIIPSLDEQHQQLFVFVYTIKEAVSEGVSLDRIEEVVKAMLDYGIGHFRYEEELLRRTSYPFAKTHASHHRELMAEVQGYLNRFGEGPMVVEGLVEFLESWLNYHILIEDHGFKEHLVSRGIQ